MARIKYTREGDSVHSSCISIKLYDNLCRFKVNIDLQYRLISPKHSG